MDEFVMGLLIENFVFYIIRNLWDLERVSGGLSGGFAAVVAVDEVFFIFGFDIGGFIRQLVFFCGVVGMKLMYGRVL